MKEIFQKAAVVVAHPDDEILWFSSVLEEAERIVVCFLDYAPMPSLGEGRRAVLAEYPLTTLACLGLSEAQSFGQGDWADPVESPHGLQIRGNATVALRYRENYERLVCDLRGRLRGCDNVLTHNPWGEYGHEDHVQVFRAVRALQAELGFNLWFSGYCGSRAVKLMLDYLDRNHLMHITRATNVALAGSIAGLYQQHNCWTWDDDYSWFERESFFREQKDGMRSDAMCPMSLPLNLLCTKFANGLHRKTGGFSRFIRPFGRIASRLGVRQLMSL